MPIIDTQQAAAEADRNVIQYPALIAQLVADHPTIPRSRIEELVMIEYDAITGGIPLVVPSIVLECVQEMMDRHR